MSEPHVIGVIDDESVLLFAVSQQLGVLGYESRTWSSAADALADAALEQLSCCLVDLKMPGLDGMAFLKQARQRLPDLPVILLSGPGTISAAGDAMRHGCFDFLEKPVDITALEFCLRRAVAQVELKRETVVLAEKLQRLGPQGENGGMIGVSQAHHSTLARLQQVARTRRSVLLMGETGTGKELAAKAIHDLAGNPAAPFVAVNMGGFSEALVDSELFGHVRGAFTGALKERRGCFELAGTGTLFLDEVSSLPLSAQAKLLRVLETGEFRRVGGEAVQQSTARVIAATNVDLQRLVAAGTFREDLFFRLNVLAVELVPLRHRREDIPVLAQHFAALCARENGIPPVHLSGKVLQAMLTYDWPGNVRELRNAMENLALQFPGMEAPTWQPPSSSAGNRTDTSSPERQPLRERLLAFEREEIHKALRSAEGTVQQAAQSLGIPRSTLYDRAEKLGIHLNAARRNSAHKNRPGT